MKKIVLIIGARPNFMKAFPVYEALKNDFELTLIHTGQHFNAKMSDVFFNQLKFPRPNIHLSLKKKTKAGDYDNKLYIENKYFLKNKDEVIDELIHYSKDLGQLGEIRDKLNIEFYKLNPDLVIVFGDVTSTLAAGLAAKTLNIDLAHVESGLRSGDLQMPEEVNRILTDHITKYYFVTEQSGVDNLKEIGITENVYLVGNTMIDTQKKYLQQALDTKYHKRLDVKSKEYVLITLHRPSNVDDLNKLKEIFNDFEELSKREKLVYPIHPRTKNNLEKLGYLQRIHENPNIVLTEPLGYLEFTCLMANCKYVVTDSGGIQEETTALDIPCFTLRENTERPSTFIENFGTNQLISKISDIELKECKSSMNLWDGKSAQRICKKLNTKHFKKYKINYNLYSEYYKNSKCIDIFETLKTKIKYEYIYLPKYKKSKFCIKYLEEASKYSKFVLKLKDDPNYISEITRIDFISDLVPNCDSLIDIGPGYQCFTDIYSLKNPNCSTKTLDILPNKWSKLDNSVTVNYCLNILNNKKFNKYKSMLKSEIVTCFEVIEHLDYKMIPEFISRLKKISQKKLYISVPLMEGPLIYKGHYNRFSFSNNKIKGLKNTIDLPVAQHNILDLFSKNDKFYILHKKDKSKSLINSVILIEIDTNN
jgi:UDP-N-acetylglucosamine 2-epimerase (non-hydrolysing)